MELLNSIEYGYHTKKCIIAKKVDITGQVKRPVDLPDGTYYLLLCGDHVVNFFKI